MRTHQLYGLHIEDSTFTLKLESEPTDNARTPNLQVSWYHSPTLGYNTLDTNQGFASTPLPHHSPTTPPLLHHHFQYCNNFGAGCKEINEANSFKIIPTITTHHSPLSQPLSRLQLSLISLSPLPPPLPPHQRIQIGLHHWSSTTNPHCHQEGKISSCNQREMVRRSPETIRTTKLPKHIAEIGMTTE